MNIKVYELTRYDTLEIIELSEYTIEIHKFHGSIIKVLLTGDALERGIDITEQVRLTGEIPGCLNCF